MTKEEKREKRRVKQALIQAVGKAHFSTRYKLTHTAAQQRADSKKVAEQILAGRNPAFIEAI